jgi:hypothetical protein
MVVSSRIADYESLATRLCMRAAIIVQPLSRSEVQEYLGSAGEPLKRLRVALAKDAALGELLNTPLMLSVAMLAYDHNPVELPPNDSVKQRRKLLFAAFIIAMLERSPAASFYSRAETIRWLRSLALVLKNSQQTIFYIEDMRANMLPAKWQRWLFQVVVAAAAGAVGGLFGIVSGLVYGDVTDQLLGTLRDRLIVGSGFGILVGTAVGTSVALVGSILDIPPVGRIAFRPENILSRLWPALRTGMVASTAGTALFAVLIRIVFGTSGVLLVKLGEHLVLHFYDFNLSVALNAGVSLGLALALLKLLSSEEVESRKRVNEGTTRSARIALALLLLFSSVALILAMLFNRGCELTSMVGAGLIAGMAGGGLYLTRHYALRLLFWVFGLAPLRYELFLEREARLLFLRRVGGGFTFFHRMFRDYCATLPEHSP